MTQLNEYAGYIVQIGTYLSQSGYRKKLAYVLNKLPQNGSSSCRNHTKIALND